MPDVLTPEQPQKVHRRQSYYPILLNVRVTQAMGDALTAHCHAIGQRPTEVLRAMLHHWMQQSAGDGKRGQKGRVGAYQDQT